MLRFVFATLLVVIMFGVSARAQARDVFYRDGEKCQRASSGYIVCRDPRDRWSEGRVVGRSRGQSSGKVFYRRNGDMCQRASSGAIVCRDPRDRWSEGYVLR
jgi:hypothetical protein